MCERESASGSKVSRTVIQLGHFNLIQFDRMQCSVDRRTDPLDMVRQCCFVLHCVVLF